MNRLEYLTRTAEEFGRAMHPIKRALKVEDLMLFGSVAKRKEEPRDVDILLIHSNPIIEEFKQIIADNNSFSDAEKLIYLKQKLHSSGVDLMAQLDGTQVMPLIAQNLFNVNYMHSDFFKNPGYRASWRAKNCNPDPQFDKRIIESGLIFNPLTNHYDIPASQRYIIPSD